MASFDRTVFQRFLGVAPMGGAGLFAVRRAASDATPALRTKTRRLTHCPVVQQEEGWSWSERIAPFGIQGVRISHHSLGDATDGAATACPAKGWGMVIAGCATLNMRHHAKAAIHSETLAEGDVWSVPAAANAWFHCIGSEQASIVAFTGGRETERDAGTWPDSCLDAKMISPGLHHCLLKQEAQRTCWGSLRVVEADAFSDPDALSAALVEIEPGCRTDLHWHLNTSVWQICLDGAGQLTRFPKGGGQHSTALRPGMMAHIPRGEGHLISNEDGRAIRMLEIFPSDHYHDLSLLQWLEASSVEDIAAHLGVDIEVVADLARCGRQPLGQAHVFPVPHGSH
ncbi:cupin domain-containing protein [Asaia bogorensis]|uniref:cupin domain-containing protein n=1 Tax=Asaia bogorensis TaxID=91915 RepID=UPI000EFA8539|nr:cupin domain-containing protein [Asaia bogorensis]